MPLLFAHLLSLIASHLPSGQGGLHDFTSVHIVFVEEHSHDFVSGFGHLFVCLPDRKIDSVEDLLGTTALNFGADTSPLGKGVWVGEYKLQTSHALVRQNTFFDLRNLTVFELDVPVSHLGVLKADLEKRLATEYPYDFFRRNCGHYIWDWLNGPDEDPTESVYLTPREALGKILEEYPPRSIRTVRSALEVLEQHILKTPEADRADLAEALSDVQRLKGIEDLRTRLLAIKVAESRANSDDYAFLQELRTESLAEPDGPEAAREIIEWQSALNARTMSAWPTEKEGPAISALATGYPGGDSQGGRLTFEAGLRDPFTQPVPEHAVKDVRFLKASLEGSEDALNAEFILLSIATQRDAGSLLGGSSSGLSVGYTDFLNPLGYSGLFASTWGGLSIRTGAGWLGARLSLTIDEIHDRINLLANPGLTWDLILPGHATHAEVHYGEAGFGARLRHDAVLSDSLTFLTEWVRSPDDEHVISAGLQFRF